MEQNLGFKYFYGTEAESFTFYRIPKVFRFRDILERAAQKTEVKSVKAEDNQSDDEV